MPRCLHDLGTAWAKRSRKVLDGPPDAKRRPASAATERGAYEKSKSKSHAADSKRPNPAQATERYSATHGRGTAGYIKQAACGFILVNPHGVTLHNQTKAGAPRAIRCRDRTAKWESNIHRAAVQLMAACPDNADAILEHVEREIMAGPDFSRCHRRSDFRSAPKVNTDRNFLARMMFVARTIEGKSWATKAKGKHGGALGRSAMRLLEVLLYVVNKRDGYLAPCYDTLATLARMSRRAVITAMRVLETMGFVTVHRRIKRVRTPFGAKVVRLLCTPNFGKNSQGGQIGVGAHQRRCRVARSRLR